MSDTSHDAARIQIDVQRRLTGEQRLRVAFEMSMLARDLLLARLRHQYPDWSEKELKHEILRCTLAPDPVPPPLQ